MQINDSIDLMRNNQFPFEPSRLRKAPLLLYIIVSCVACLLLLIEMMVKFKSANEQSMLTENRIDDSKIIN